MTIAHVLERFVTGFNDDSLDDVMDLFADDREITGKFSYASYGRPQRRGDLGRGAQPGGLP